MIYLYLVFRFFKGRCDGNQLILGKCHERRLIPLAFFALSLENELQYHCLNVCINSGDDMVASCKNLVNFCQVTPEIMGLIFVPRYLYLAKIDLHICYRSETPWSIGTLMGALTAAMIRLHHIWWVSDQYIHSLRESTVCNRRQLVLWVVCLRSLGGSPFTFRYTTC